MDLHLSAPWDTLEREAASGLLCISDAVKLVDFAQSHARELERVQAENERLRALLAPLDANFWCANELGRYLDPNEYNGIFGAIQRAEVARLLAIFAHAAHPHASSVIPESEA